MGAIRRAKAVATLSGGGVIVVMVIITAAIGAVVTAIAAFDGLGGFGSLGE